MKDTNISQKKISQDIHLKNIFIRDTYLEFGIIDVDIMQKLLKYELININDLTFFPVQNKGLGHSTHQEPGLRNSLPYYFFYKLATNNPAYTLCITYGLIQYKTVDRREAFMPVIVIPIKMYFENNELFVQMICRPVENPMLHSILHNSKISFMQNLDFLDIKALDYTLHTLGKLTGIGVRPDNYLTYFHQKEKDIILPNKNINTFRIPFHMVSDKIYRNKKIIYSSKILNKEQRIFVERSLNRENLTLTGFSGTGKTTTLKNIIINNMANELKTLYVTDSKETIDDVYQFLCDLNLDNYCANLTNSFPKMIALNNKEQPLLPVEDTKDLYLKIAEYYDELDRYENEMNRSVFGFKFVEAIDEFFVIDEELLIDQIDEIKDDIDDLSFIYKHEYADIYKVLKTLEQTSKKIKSFKNSVWSAIPIVNNIKHVNQVLNIVFQLNQGLKKLREHEVSLGDFGVKGIQSFSEMKKYIAPLDKMNASVLPDAWKTSLEKYEEAKNIFSELKKDLYNFQEAEYRLSIKYNDLPSVDIEKEIKNLYGNFYREKNIDIILELLKNEKEILRKINATNINLETYLKVSEEISTIINWNFLEKDLYVNEINRLYEIVYQHHINGKMLNMILNNRATHEIQRMNNIDKAIKNLKEEVSSYIKIGKRAEKIEKSRGHSSNNEYRIYDMKIKKIKKLSKEYSEICGVFYEEHEKNLVSIKSLEEYYNEIKPKKYRKILVDFIQNLDDDDYIQILSLLNIRNDSFAAITSSIEYFSAYQVSFEGLTVKAKIEKLTQYITYLNQLFDLNKRMMKIIINSELEYVPPKEYYEMKKMLSDYQCLIEGLRNAKQYHNVYDNLYVGEETNIMNIMKIMQMYDAYIFVFTDKQKVYDSFHTFDKLHAIASDIVNLVSEIGENLRLYSLIFKDSVSRYYFSNIEANVDYLSKLLSSKEELILYLGITQGIGVLNNYGLHKLINYIEKNDDIKNLSEIFKYIYFKGLIEGFLSERQYLLDTAGYRSLLDKTIALEEIINKANSNKIINDIIRDNPWEYKIQKPKRPGYFNYIKYNYKRLKVYLMHKDLAISYAKDLDYDVIIIDDAHMIVTGEYGSLFRGKQTIICGDYQNNKIVNQNLVSLAPNAETIVLKLRYVNGPRGLTNNILFTKSPHIKDYDKNIGVKVLEKNLDEYLYNLFIDDCHVKINYFIKNVNLQRAVYEEIAESFYSRLVPPEDITTFLTENLFITDVNNRIYQKSDYNIIYLKDYCDEDSQIVASNIFEILVLASKELIIYDSDNILLKDIRYEFLKRIKSLVFNNNSFIGSEINNVTKKIKQVVEAKGYGVYFPGNGINFTIRKKDANQYHELVTVIILYTNGATYEMLNTYRDFCSQYSRNGHKVIFRVAMDLYSGLEKFVDNLLEEVNG